MATAIVSPSLHHPFVAVTIDPMTPPIQDVTTVHLSWTGLSVASKSTSTKETQTVPQFILDSVTGEAQPRELLAVVGPNRAGKPALLRTLANPSQASAGTVQFTKHNPVLSQDTGLLKSIGHVGRDELVQPALTIQDHLSLQARLRLPTQPTQLEITNHVERVLTQVNLTEQAHIPIGQLPSNADRKLVAIATELLTSPSVLILDEPTHGLDSVDADRIVNTLHQLARNGHTVIASFNETTSSVFRLADKLHLLAEGRTVYRGTPSGMVSHFESHSVTFPPFTNPLEFFIHCSATSAVRLINAWTLDTTVVRSTVAVPGDLKAPHINFSRSGLAQFWILSVMNWRRIVTDKAALTGRSVVMVAIAVVLGLIFSQLKIDQRDIQPFTSATFFLVASQFISTTLLELGAMPHQVSIALSDHKKGAYHALSWYAAKNITELPLQLFFPMVFLIPAYFTIGYTPDFQIFFTFYWFLVLIVAAGTAVGYFAAAAAPRPELTKPFGIPILAASMLLGGAFVNRVTTPSYLLWLQQVSPVKYAYHGAMRAFWSTVDSIYCPPNTVCRATSGLTVLTTNVIKPDHFVSDSLILLAIILTLRIAGAFALWRRARQQ